MTKIITAAPASPTEALVDVRPDTIVITELSYKAWPAAAYLIRQGWAVHSDMPPLAFLNTGFATITLVRAKPDASISALAAEIAQKAEELASARHLVAYTRDVEAAAVAAAANAKKAEAAALLAAEIESQRQTLAALEKAANAAA